MPEPSTIITLLTDFGTADPYAGIMKGVILSINPSVVIVDVSHGVGPQDVEEAAYLVPEYAPFFPAGTIHIAVVDPTVGSARRPIAIVSGGRFFIGPDNGIFSQVMGGVREVYEIAERRYMADTISSTFHGRDIFAPAAAYLSLGLPAARLGPPVSNTVILDSLAAEIQGGVLYGKIIRFDRFGNAITNISERAFREFVGERPYRISLGKLTFDRIASTYHGEGTACIPGSNGYLEFALFKGSFRDDYGAWKGDEVTVTPLP